MSVLLFNPEGESPMNSILMMSGDKNDKFEIKNGCFVRPRKYSTDSIKSKSDDGLSVASTGSSKIDQHEQVKQIQLTSVKNDDDDKIRAASTPAENGSRVLSARDKRSQQKREQANFQQSALNSSVHRGVFV